MYKSGQFIHFLSLKEDWFEEADGPSETIKAIRPGSILDIGETVNTLTEIYEFLSRLAKHGIYKDGIGVEVGLYNVRNVSRELKILNPRRLPLVSDYVTETQKISFLKQYSEKEVLQHSKGLAMDTILEIFSRFNWDDPPLETIIGDQQELLGRDS